MMVVLARSTLELVFSWSAEPKMSLERQMEAVEPVLLTKARNTRDSLVNVVS